MKKTFLTNSEKRIILENREKVIIENFTNTFNRIKRIDENEMCECGMGMYEHHLTEPEQQVVNDILGEANSLYEIDFNSVLEKVKNYAKRGALTGAVVAALMASPKINAQQKQQIQQFADTEMAHEEPTGAESIVQKGGIELGKKLVEAFLLDRRKAWKWQIEYNKAHRHMKTYIVDNISVGLHARDPNALQQLGDMYNGSNEKNPAQTTVDFLKHMGMQ